MTLRPAPIQATFDPLDPAWVLWFQMAVAEINGKEPGLGKPAVDGQVLTSTVAGVRSWSSIDLGGA